MYIDREKADLLINLQAAISDFDIVITCITASICSEVFHQSTFLAVIQWSRIFKALWCAATGKHSTPSWIATKNIDDLYKTIISISFISYQYCCKNSYTACHSFDQIAILGQREFPIENVDWMVDSFTSQKGGIRIQNPLNSLCTYLPQTPSEGVDSSNNNISVQITF